MIEFGSSGNANDHVAAAGVLSRGTQLYLWCREIYFTNAACTLVGCRPRSIRLIVCFSTPMISASSTWVRPRDWRMAANSVDVIAILRGVTTHPHPMPFLRHLPLLSPWSNTRYQCYPPRKTIRILGLSCGGIVLLCGVWGPGGYHHCGRLLLF
jgi:hypothetical protein